MPSFRFLLRSFSASSTLAVNDAVAASLMVLGVGVARLLGRGVDCLDPSIDTGASDTASVETAVAASVSPVFFRFFDPGAFFRACVKPCSFSFWARADSRSISAAVVDNIGIIFSESNGSLHCRSNQSSSQ